MATINGTPGNDTLIGTADPDWINGGAGNDTIDGGGGSDTLDGGSDNDSVVGGDGNDTITSSSGNDTLLGGAGNDVFNVSGIYVGMGPQETVVVDGGDGDDTIRLNGGPTGFTLTATGGAGSDTYVLPNSSGPVFTVTDFTAGAGGDRIDVASLLSASTGYTGGNPFDPTLGYLRLVQSGNDTLLQYDRDGSGIMSSWATVLTLTGVTAAALTADNFVGGLPPDGSAIPGQIVSGSGLLQGGYGDDTITGSLGNDFISGSYGNDSINGDAGNDTINGDAGNDTIYGGAGNDSLEAGGSAGNDSVFGDDGNDTITSSSGNDTLLGGAGNDVFNVSGIYVGMGTQETVVVDGGDGDDTIRLNGGPTGFTLTATGGAGSDTYVLPNSSGPVFTVTDFTAGAGGDRIDVASLLSASTGYTGGNPFDPTLGYLRLVQSGNDTLLQYDRDGSGIMSSWATVLTLTGVTAAALTADNFVGGLPPDGSAIPGQILSGSGLLQGGYGDDTITGSLGNDFISGSYGNDSINGDAGNDTINGDAGNDTIYGGAGNDSLEAGGSAGNDSVFGDDGNDTITSSSGNDTLLGGAGNDVFNVSGIYVGMGTQETVVVDGGDGDDTIRLNGGPTGFTLTATGGAGSDTYVLPNSSGPVFTVTDFTAGAGGDRIDVASLLSASTGYTGGSDPFVAGYLRLMQSGTDTLLQYDRDGPTGTMSSWATVLTLAGVTAAALTNANFTGGWQPIVANTPPSSSNDSVTTLEDTAVLLGVGDFGSYIDAENTPLASVKITTLPVAGSLQFNNGSGWVAVTQDQVISRTDLDAGNLKFVPGADANGSAYASIGFKVSDGTAFATNANTLTVNVTAINDAPTLETALTDQVASLGQPFTYAVPGSAFADIDAGDSLTLSASLADGNPLPAWLSFNAATGTLSGTTPDGTPPGAVNVKITATDSGALSVSDTFTLNLLSIINGTASADTLNGTAFSDMINGLAGNDRLYGGSGNDTLDGGAGNDTMWGGLGDDLYRVGSTSDVVIENANQGRDRVETMLASYTLSNNVEDLIFTGTGNFKGAGNGLGNSITGGAGNDTLSGGNGNDTLDGGAGNDQLVGGAGNDTYRIDSLGDVVKEDVNKGVDTVSVELATGGTYKLTANLENATVGNDTAGVNLTGNGLNNRLVGNDAANVLDGDGGDDVLLGAGGGDSLFGGNGSDWLYGGTGSDLLTGGKGADYFVFDTTPGEADMITDFARGTDKIALSKALFDLAGAVGKNTCLAGLTGNGSGVFAYDSGSGALTYDADGAGVGADAVTVAIIGQASHPAALGNDFIIVS